VTTAILSAVCAGAMRSTWMVEDVLMLANVAKQCSSLMKHT